MGKVERALRELIQYHGKRVASDVLGKLPQQVRQLREDVRALMGQVSALEAAVRGKQEQSVAQVGEEAIPAVSEEEVAQSRFSRRGLKSLRKRLDLSQQQLAKLLHVAPVTVASWEAGRTRPRPDRLAQIVALRSMKPEEVDQALGREPAPPAMSADDVKALRQKIGLTQAELAQLLGVSTAAVTSWESGRTSPARDKRRGLAEIRQLSRSEVLARLGRSEELATVEAKGGISPEEIRALRKQAGLSQAQLAARLGVSVNSVSNWETGNTAPRRRSLEKLLAMRE